MSDTALTAAQAINQFTEALAASEFGPELRFGDRIEQSAMDLFTAILNELEFCEIGEPEWREGFAVQLTRRIARDARTPAPFQSQVASR